MLNQLNLCRLERLRHCHRLSEGLTGHQFRHHPVFLGIDDAVAYHFNNEVRDGPRKHGGICPVARDRGHHLSRNES